MSDPEPEERIADRTRGQPEHIDYGDFIAAIPLVYVTGLFVWWSLDLQMHLALAGSSLLAIGALVDALFLNPPTP